MYVYLCVGGDDIDIEVGGECVHGYEKSEKGANHHVLLHSKVFCVITLFSSPQPSSLLGINLFICFFLLLLKTL